MVLKSNIKMVFCFLIICLILEALLSKYLIRINPSLFYLLLSYTAIIMGGMIILGRNLGFAISCCFVFILHLANRVKREATGEPLGYFDLISLENFSIVYEYIEAWHYLFIAFFCFSLVYLRRYFLGGRFYNFNIGFFSLFIISLLLNPLASEYFSFQKYFHFLKNMEFISWRLDTNVRKNGLINHIYQTSKVKLPDTNGGYWDNSSYFEVLEGKEKSNIFFVMCESCWDEDGVVGISSKLKSKGFREFSLISPVYGGGTVNAAFEVLTGMASKSDLNGILYQGYADLMHEDVMSYPRMLKNFGYETFVLHNNKKTFWRRHLVNPKLGFDEFYGVEDMDSDETRPYVRDTILYKKAYSIFEKNNKNKSFYFLTTMHSHGKYKVNNNDYGFNDYADRVNISVDDFLNFFDKVKEKDSNAIFLFFGDHKPGLTEFFESNKYFDSSKDWKSVGRVPAFIHSSDKSKIDLSIFEGMPFYCFSYEFSKNITGVINQPMKYLEDNELCIKENFPKENRIKYPVNMYYEFLLKQ